MKGFIRTARAACLLAGVVALVGCHSGYRDVVDPCYPERYSFVSHNIVCGIRKTQVNNGHILDQTVWNWHFDYGKSVLNAAGMDHLTYLVRRRPSPDTVIYLATAHDLRYNPAEPGKLAELRADLDGRRIDAIRSFLNAHAPGPDMNFQILVHDPAEPGMPAQQAQVSIGQWNSSAIGTGIGSGGSAGGTAGGSATATTGN
jgi:hypothetical protein